MKCKPIRGFYIIYSDKTRESCAINFTPTQSWDWYDIGNNLVELQHHNLTLTVNRGTFEKLFIIEERGEDETNMLSYGRVLEDVMKKYN